MIVVRGFLSNLMEYNCGDCFPFDFEPNRIPFGAQINRRRVITIRIRFDSTRSRKKYILCVCHFQVTSIHSKFTLFIYISFYLFIFIYLFIDFFLSMYIWQYDRVDDFPFYFTTKRRKNDRKKKYIAEKMSARSSFRSIRIETRICLPELKVDCVGPSLTSSTS